ncbi:MinD/ParA family protein [Streptomyces sp. NBC_00154]|uniref:nucleotide-binding protein n=1 Tax=Streptomyces sp. NBC_00154 TaxID=2975670 RepID=UPI00224CDCF4|nr:MinD/ParA family protein [Streptomyces sp. NBC_00154]MCX5311636.1 MinD/ParA family protein [Streptomyces sp. NBC_00154]
MPNGDNWQGDVLRDLRGGAGRQSEPQQGPPQQGAGQQGAQGPAGQAQGGPTPNAAPGHAAPQQVAPASESGYGYPPSQGAPAAPVGYAQPAPAPDAAYGYPPQQQAGPIPDAPYGYAPQQQGAPAPDPAYGYPPQQAVPAQQQPRATPAHTSAYTPTTRPHHTPDSRPVVDKSLVTAGRKPRHGQSFASRATRALRRTVSSSAAKEVAEITRIAEVLQQPVTTGRQISVTSIRGGAGKTTVAALLGTTYAHYRQDPVLVVEADPALGSLPLRLGAETLRWTIGDFADIVEPQMSLLDITGYLVQLPGNAWLLPGSQGQIGAMLGSKAYEGVMVSLRRYFGVTVVDCETLPAEVARVALSASQARVLTAPATLEGVTSTYSVLQWMQGLPQHVIAGTVVVLTELVPHPGLDLAEAAEKLRSTGASVQVLPYDRHLAAGGLIRTELLAHSTREAATRLAADVFQLSQKRH